MASQVFGPGLQPLAYMWDYPYGDLGGRLDSPVIPAEKLTLWMGLGMVVVESVHGIDRST